MKLIIATVQPMVDLFRRERRRMGVNVGPNDRACHHFHDVATVDPLSRRVTFANSSNNHKPPGDGSRYRLKIKSANTSLADVDIYIFFFVCGDYICLLSSRVPLRQVERGDRDARGVKANFISWRIHSCLR